MKFGFKVSPEGAPLVCVTKWLLEVLSDSKPFSSERFW